LEGGARTANGTYKVNQATLENIQIPIPDFERQVEFGKVAQSITSRRLEQKASADYSHTLFSSLQQRAFRGELDLSRLVLDSQDDSPLAPEPEKPSTKATKPKPATLVLQAPQTTESAVRKLDDTVSRSEPIPWSADYFKYRILGERSAPFTFGEVMQKAESVFDELPPYEEIKDMILELLGQGGGPAVLRQRFEQVDEKSKEVSGSKEIVFGPAA
jgi:type I restriction enzyme S subunit